LLGVQVGKYPDDFDCYRRAENMPDEDEKCPLSARRTLFSNASYPAADAASYGSAGLAAAAALLQGEDPALAKEMIVEAEAMYDFALRFPETAVKWSTVEVAKTYPVTNGDQMTLFTEAMMAYVRSCSTPGAVLCNSTQAHLWTDLALRHWDERVVRSLSGSAV
jgi:hypothetical protein